jgi:hypothetical protein
MRALSGGPQIWFGFVSRPRAGEFLFRYPA